MTSIYPRCSQARQVLRRARYAVGKLLFCVLAWSLSSTAWAGGNPAGTPPTPGATPSVAEVLNPDGSLRPGARGSFSTTGFSMSTAADGHPVFTRTTGTGDEKWQDGFNLAGVNNQAYAVAVMGTDVYVGGYFTSAGGVAANNVAKWDGTSWSALGTGVDDRVHALAVIGTDLYVGGYFLSAGGAAAYGVAKWNGTSWSSLGTGIMRPEDGTGNGTAYALAVIGTDLYVGGAFTLAGGQAANRVAKWNGASWSSLGTGTANGVNSTVYALAVSGTDLYAGGDFTTAGGAAAHRVAKWSGTSWSSLGTGTANGVGNSVFALAVSGTDLYVGGFFTSAGGVTANRIAKWDGANWSSLGTGAANGVDNPVRSLLVSGTDLYVGGEFPTAGGTTVNNIAKWDGTSWSALGTGTADGMFNIHTANAAVYALAMIGPNLYGAGWFTTAGGTAASRVAKWDGTSWSRLATGAANGLNGTNALSIAVNAVAIMGSDVYVGGTFTAAGGVVASRVAKWDGTSWSSLGTGPNNGVSGSGSFYTVYALAVMGSDLYVGGTFTSAGGVPANSIARWNGTSWSSLGMGTANGVGGGAVNALAVSGTDLYVGGDLTAAGGVAANRVAKWDGASWSSLGTGVTRSVRALAVIGTDLYVGGTFDFVGSTRITGIAKWNGSTWSPLGTGIDRSEVNALAVSGTNLYVGGFFSLAGGVPVNSLARWDGASWSSVGTGINPVSNSTQVYALAVSGTDLYVGGNLAYVTVGGAPVKNIAKWDGSAWSTLGTGLNGRVNDIVVGAGPKVYVGGTFNAVGDGSKGSSNFAIYNDGVQLPDLVVSTAAGVPAGAYQNVTVTGTGAAVLAGPLSVQGQLRVQSNGTLDDGGFPITGPGSVSVAAGATLIIRSAQGLSASGSTGSVQVTGTRRFSRAARYVYAGSAAQSTGSGLPGRVRDLTISNANDVSLTQPVAIRGVLSLTTAGNLQLAGHMLILLSDADSTAVVSNVGAGQVAGAATVQRYLSGTLNPGAGYRQLAAPISSATVASLTTTGFTPEVNPAYNTSATPGSVTPFPTVFGYDEARTISSPATSFSAFDKGWVSPAGLADPLAPGRGYTVNLAASQTLNFVGPLNNGPVSQTMARSGPDGGWHLLGNPYPSPLDWSLVTVPAGVDNAVYVFESTTQYRGGYRSYVNGVGNPKIAMGQGFFVRAGLGSTPATLTLTNAARTTEVRTADAPLNRTTPETRPLVQLSLRAAGGAVADTYVYFQTGATSGFDPAYDAHQLPGTNALGLASVANGAELNINGLPLSTAVVVPLSLRLPQTGSFTLEAAQLLNFTAGSVYLFDAQTGQQINLAQQPSYTFHAGAGSGTGRLELRLSPSSITAAKAGALANGTSLYPNPARGSVWLTVPAGLKTQQVEVLLYNVMGQLVRRSASAYQPGGSSFEVDLAGLTAGVYSLRLQAGSETVSKRLVVE